MKTINELWEDKAFAEAYSKAYSALDKLPNVETVNIVMTYKDVSDKLNVSAVIPELWVVMWMLKMALKRAMSRMYYTVIGKEVNNG